MSPEFRTALLRGVILGAIAAGSVFFAVLGADQSLRAAEIGAGAAFFATLGSRFVGEGAIDTRAAKQV